MRRNFTRRNFVITTAINAIGMAAYGNIKIMGVVLNPETNPEKSNIKNTEEQPFIPVRAASWWCNIEDLLWPQKKIVDKIKYRAEAFAKAKIDTAINFGFHIRFDLSNYFGQLHGYYSNVCDELHKYGIRFIDHYSCNHVERPRGIEEFKKLHKTQRHHVLLFHDPVAAEYAQYE